MDKASQREEGRTTPATWLYTEEPRLVQGGETTLKYTHNRRAAEPPGRLADQVQDEQFVPVTNRYIAFLRAINVGKRTVQMARLREIASGLGLADVATFIASGNLIFRDPKSRAVAVLEPWLTQELAKALGFHTDVFLRTPVENARAAFRTFGDWPEFPPSQHSLYIGMLHRAPSAEVLSALRGAQTPVDRFFVDGRELYWLCAKTIGTSDFSGAKLEKLLGAPTTMRNVTSIRKLAALYPE